MSSDPLAHLAGLEGVSSAFAATRDGIDALLRDRGLRRTSPEVTAESLLRGAQASAVLAGATVSLADLREGESDAPSRAALRVSTELLSLTPVILRSPLQALARLHTVSAMEELPEEKLGRPRDDEAARRLRALADLITGRTTAPALLVAGVVHAEVASVAPFGSHNGLIARAAERLVLVALGVDEKSLLVPEAGHLALRAEYESNLIGYRDGGLAGLHSWLLYSAQAFAAGAEASPLHQQLLIPEPAESEAPPDPRALPDLAAPRSVAPERVQAGEPVQAAEPGPPAKSPPKKRAAKKATGTKPAKAARKRSGAPSAEEG